MPSRRIPTYANLKFEEREQIINEVLAEVYESHRCRDRRVLTAAVACSIVATRHFDITTAEWNQARGENAYALVLAVFANSVCSDLTVSDIGESLARCNDRRVA